jgi:hypothetical protein
MVFTFDCTVSSFINEDWELIEHVVDFKPLEDKEHEGLYAGKAFVDGTRKCGGLDKISKFFRYTWIYVTDPSPPLLLHKLSYQQHICQ